MDVLPDDALVVRGGQNLPDSFTQGSGVQVATEGVLQGVSVNSGANVSVEQLTAANAQTGYPGIPHNRIGVTTVGAIRAAGGDVVPDPTRTNGHHALLHGITAEQASALFRPTVKNLTKAKP
jgi:hypothetical protein